MIHHQSDGPLSDQDLEGFRSHTIGNQSGAFVAILTQVANERSLQLLDRLGFAPDTEFEEYGEPQTQVRLLRPSIAEQS